MGNTGNMGNASNIGNTGNIGNAGNMGNAGNIGNMGNTGIMGNEGYNMCSILHCPNSSSFIHRYQNDSILNAERLKRTLLND